MTVADATIWCAILIALGLAAWTAKRELGLRAFLAAPVLAALGAGVSFAALQHLSVDDALILGALAPTCLLIAEIDRRFHLIPDPLVAAILVLACAAAQPPWQDKVLGAAALLALFYGVRIVFAAAGRADALGLGDVKLAAAMGAFLGPSAALLAVALSGAATIAALMMLAPLKIGRAKPLAGAPFGIGLAAALLVTASIQLAVVS